MCWQSECSFGTSAGSPATFSARHEAPARPATKRTSKQASNLPIKQNKEPSRKETEAKELQPDGGAFTMRLAFLLLDPSRILRGVSTGGWLLSFPLKACKTGFLLHIHNGQYLLSFALAKCMTWGTTTKIPFGNQDFFTDLEHRLPCVFCHFTNIRGSPRSTFGSIRLFALSMTVGKLFSFSMLGWTDCFSCYHCAHSLSLHQSVDQYCSLLKLGFYS